MSDQEIPPANPAGWYPDGSGSQRWWDGTQWTENVQAEPQAQMPVVMQQPAYAGQPGMTGPPPPPWGTWTWADGSPISMAALPPYDPGKKLTCGLLGILLGGFGIHKFILGRTNAGIIQIVATIFTCGLAGIIGIVEGIMYLTKTDAEFYWTYVAGQKEWF